MLYGGPLCGSGNPARPLKLNLLLTPAVRGLTSRPPHALRLRNRGRGVHVNVGVVSSGRCASRGTSSFGSSVSHGCHLWSARCVRATAATRAALWRVARRYCTSTTAVSLSLDGFSLSGLTSFSPRRNSDTHPAQSTCSCAQSHTNASKQVQ